MTGYLLRRVAASLAVLFFVLSLSFFVVRLAPGDPAERFADPRLSRAQIEQLRRVYGLDRPLAVQYLSWLRSVLKGDWGVSFSHHRPVGRVLRAALPNTLLLGGSALAIQYGLGILLGVVAARRAGSPTDHLLRVGSLLLYSVPIFWLGLMAILVFSEALPVFPPGGLHRVGSEAAGAAARLGDLAWHLILPATVLGLTAAGGIARFVRNSMLEVEGREFVRALRARGVSERRIVWVHELRNAAVPVAQLFGLSLPYLLSGSLILEVVFSWPGLGRVAYGAALARDYPLILATTAVSGTLVVVGNLLADLLHGLLDPRVRRG